MSENKVIVSLDDDLLNLNQRRDTLIFHNAISLKYSVEHEQSFDMLST